MAGVVRTTWPRNPLGPARTRSPRGAVITPTGARPAAKGVEADPAAGDAAATTAPAAVDVVVVVIVVVDAVAIGEEKGERSARISCTRAPAPP